MSNGNDDIINCGNDDADGSEDSMMSEKGVPEVENPVVVDIDIALVPPSVVGPEDCGENRKAPAEGLFAGDLSKDWITNPADFLNIDSRENHKVAPEYMVAAGDYTRIASNLQNGSYLGTLTMIVNPLQRT